MPRRVFFSFHYKPDAWRVSQIRNIGTIEENKPANDNDWESVEGGGENAIKNWINNQLTGRSCTIVLVGEETAGRKYIEYEIEESWNKGMGIVGIYIHNLKNDKGLPSRAGTNPFEHFFVGNKFLSQIAKLYYPPNNDSKSTYNYIKDNIENWIDEAIALRESHKKLNAIQRRGVTSERLAQSFGAWWRETPTWKEEIKYSTTLTGKYSISKNGLTWTSFPNDGSTLKKYLYLRFKAQTNTPTPYTVFWQIVNTGSEAINIGAKGLRGEITESNSVGAGGLSSTTIQTASRDEKTLYSGTHWIECYIIKNDICIAKSGPFILTIF